MKIASDYYEKGLGKAMGYLVGALVVGTALPHLLRALGSDVDWRPVVIWISILAVIGGLMIGFLIQNGPYRKPGLRLEFKDVMSPFRVSAFKRAAFGYVGAVRTVGICPGHGDLHTTQPATSNRFQYAIFCRDWNWWNWLYSNWIFVKVFWHRQGSQICIGDIRILLSGFTASSILGQSDVTRDISFDLGHFSSCRLSDVYDACGAGGTRNGKRDGNYNCHLYWFCHLNWKYSTPELDAAYRGYTIPVSGISAGSGAGAACDVGEEGSK
jgi:hypothetical protein